MSPFVFVFFFLLSYFFVLEYGINILLLHFLSFKTIIVKVVYVMALPESYRPKWVMNKVGSRNCAQPNRPIFIFFLGGMAGTFGFFFWGF
jgi:hypothetical protein